MARDITIQIIIPCINLWENYTKPCIDSVIKAAEMAMKPESDGVGMITGYRILLVDNASSDETITEAGKLVSNTFAHQRNEERWGFQRTVNFGVNDAWERGYTYAFVINNDVLLNPYAIVELIDRMSDDQDLGMVTCMDITGECETPEAIFDKNPIDKESTPESEHPNFSGFMIRRNVWRDVGEFDETFFPAYYEDNDYHYRMMLAGKKAIVYPRSLFYHYGSRTQLEALGGGKRLTDTSNQHKEYIRKWGGDPMKEQFKVPYNDAFRSIRGTKQNPSA